MKLRFHERIAITDNLGVKYEEFNYSNNEKVKSFTQINSQVVYYKNYYLICIPLKEQKYRDTLEFSEILIENNLRHNYLRYELKINTDTLCKAKRGENVSKEWALKFSENKYSI